MPCRAVPCHAIPISPTQRKKLCIQSTVCAFPFLTSTCFKDILKSHFVHVKKAKAEDCWEGEEDNSPIGSTNEERSDEESGDEEIDDEERDDGERDDEEGNEGIDDEQGDDDELDEEVEEQEEVMTVEQAEFIE